MSLRNLSLLRWVSLRLLHKAIFSVNVIFRLKVSACQFCTIWMNNDFTVMDS